MSDKNEVTQRPQALIENLVVPHACVSEIRSIAFERSTTDSQQDNMSYPRPSISTFRQEFATPRRAIILRQFRSHAHISWNEDNKPQKGYVGIRPGFPRSTMKRLQRRRESQRRQCNAAIDLFVTKANHRPRPPALQPPDTLNQRTNRCAPYKNLDA